MAESVQIQSISHRHQAIVDWLLTNPEVKNLNVLCQQMNVTRAWLSVVMNSDVFKDYYAKRRAAWEANMHDEIGQKLLRLASQTIDKMAEIVADDETDPRLVHEACSKTLDRLGFAPKAGRTIVEEKTQEFTRSVPAGVVGEAREILRRTTIEVKEEKPGVKALPSP